MLRGHLDLSGPVTAAELADRCALPASKVAIGWRCWSRPASPSRAASPTPSQRRSSGAPGGSWPACTPTPAPTAARRSSRSPPSTSCASHCAGSTSPPAPSCGATAACGSPSSSCRASRRPRPPGSREILRRRVADYQPSYLDRLCHDGEVTWLRLTAAQPASDRRSSPSKATPVALAFREDLMWLLQSARLAPPASAPARAPGTAPARAHRPAGRAGRAGGGGHRRGRRGAEATGAPSSWPSSPR